MEDREKLAMPRLLPVNVGLPRDIDSADVT